MYKKIILIIITIIIYLLICNIIYNKNIYIKKVSIENKLLISKIIPIEKPIGRLIITKINIDNKLYKINSKYNNVEKNITILNGSIPPENNNSIIFIAAHSGTGEKAYFKDLDKLNIDDEITLIYKNKKYKYVINKIWEDKKDGYIHINKEEINQLVLTTCSPKNDNNQLIINSILKGAN